MTSAQQPLDIEISAIGLLEMSRLESSVFSFRVLNSHTNGHPQSVLSQLSVRQFVDGAPYDRPAYLWIEEVSAFSDKPISRATARDVSRVILEEIRGRNNG